MYNRYVPGHDGVYLRKTVEDTTPVINCEMTEPPEQPRVKTVQQQKPCRNTSDGFDLGDLLLLCIVILLLVDSDEDDSFPLLIMAAAFLFLQ